MAHQVINGMGGWIKVCESLMEAQETWFRKDFIRACRAYASASNGDEIPKYLPGRIEAENRDRFPEAVSELNYLGDIPKKPDLKLIKR